MARDGRPIGGGVGQRGEVYIPLPYLLHHTIMSACNEWNTSLSCMHVQDSA